MLPGVREAIGGAVSEASAGSTLMLGDPAGWNRRNRPEA